MDTASFAAFKDGVRRFVRERLVSLEPEVIAAERVTPAMIAEMNDMGLFALTIPTEYGGLGLSISEYIDTMMGNRVGHAGVSFRVIHKHRHACHGP